ncbi:competence protein CoiA [Alkalihalobacillus sp. 1P02AB]|uniref:competence protein CoiA n=1 Tax=Alkalihalobacillus sp. 1P02AB TaxID=3132260 RepID=UPI0039A675CB
MLNAKIKTGIQISMADAWKKGELDALRKKTTFLCPACQKEVLLKLGEKRVWHFAHKANHACKLDIEPETEYHLKGKKQLFQWLKSQRLDVALEVYLPIIRQRPDLLVRTSQQLYAIEFQCSPISIEHIRKRNAGYQQMGVIPIWIMGGNRLKRKKSSSFTVQAFEWEMMQQDQGEKNLKLLYYCPQANKWTFLNEILPYSKTLCQAKLLEQPLNDCTFYTLLKETNLRTSSYQKWCSIRKQWRMNPPAPYPTKTLKKFQMLLYRNQLPPSFFPVEAGWPTKYFYQIEVSPLIWQTSFILECLEYQPFMKPLDFRMLFQWFLTFLHSSHISVRFENLELTEDAFYHYLLWLCELDLLSQMESSDKIFLRLHKSISFATLQDALFLDNELTENFTNYQQRNPKKVLF